MNNFKNFFTEAKQFPPVMEHLRQMLINPPYNYNIPLSIVNRFPIIKKGDIKYTVLAAKQAEGDGIDNNIIFKVSFGFNSVYYLLKIEYPIFVNSINELTDIENIKIFDKEEYVFGGPDTEILSSVEKILNRGKIYDLYNSWTDDKLTKLTKLINYIEKNRKKYDILNIKNQIYKLKIKNKNNNHLTPNDWANAI